MVDKDMDVLGGQANCLQALKPAGLAPNNEAAQNLAQRPISDDSRPRIHGTQRHDFLQLRPHQAVQEIISYWEETIHSDLRFASLLVHSCYFGYAPVWEAEISYRDFPPIRVLSDLDRVSAIDSVECSSISASVRAIDSLLSGAVAGVLSRSCTAPLDRLKVHGYQHAGSSAVSAFRWMLREGGARSLWRGNGTNVLKIAPETAVKYTAYDMYKDLLGVHKDQHRSSAQQPLYEKFLAGSLAGATSQTLIYPMEVVKTRMCLRKTGQYGGILNCLVSVYREDGLRALYRGYSVTLLGILPYAGIELATYETARTHLLLSAGDIVPPAAAPLVAGALASSLGIVTCYPLALLRSKLQSRARFSQPGLNTVRGLAAAILRDEGPAGFYRGMAANLVRVLPAVAISFAAFEHMKSRFHAGPALSGEA